MQQVLRHHDHLMAKTTESWGQPKGLWYGLGRSHRCLTSPAAGEMCWSAYGSVCSVLLPTSPPSPMGRAASSVGMGVEA